MNFCIAGRCEGISSTSDAPSGIACDSECSRNSTGSGSPACGAGGSVRPFGAARCSPAGARAADSAGFIVAMMLVPTGVTAAASGSSVIWKIVAPPSKIAAWPSTWKVNTGAPITTTSRARAARRTIAPARRAGSPRTGMTFRERAARRKRADPDLALAFSARAPSSRPRRRDRRRGRPRGQCLRTECGDQRLHRVSLRPDLATDLAGFDRASHGPIDDRDRHESRPHGGCIAV